MNGKVKTSVVICAAGRGERAGFGKNKLLAPLYGAPVLYHTLCRFSRFDEIIVTCSTEDMPEITAICAPFNAKAVSGGETRTLSVYNALKEVNGEIVLIHDGARPFVSEEIIDECIDSVKNYGSGICAAPVTDTVAQTEDGRIISVPERSSLRAVQTPQGFITKDIKSAYERAVDSGKTFTDDSSVYLEYFGRPKLCRGDSSNIKLTYRSDFPTEYPSIDAAEGQSAGIGIDVHAFGKKQSFITLCGVKIDSESGLIAHSDGDVAVHAVMDALLSSAGLKDIGRYFPDSDPKYSGADSVKLLERVIELLKDEGYKPINLSLTIQAEKPRLAAHIPLMKENLARATGISPDRVGISAGTCEKLGFVGQGLGIAAYAVALCAKI